MVRLCIIIAFFLSGFSYAQKEYHFLLHLNNYRSHYSDAQVTSVLSNKAITYKNNQGIEIDSTDYPIHLDYMDSLNSLPVKIEAKSKWFRKVVVSRADSVVSDLNFSFIEKVEFIGVKNEGASKNDRSKLDFGITQTQSDLINLSYVFNNSKGEDVEIAVIDGGFKNADDISYFDSIWNNNQIKSAYDFVNNRPVDFNGHEHGTVVLSLLAANSPGTIIGSAPNANYHLLVSEDVNQENLLEEFHLIEALEYCDSAGVNISNISLGYADFETNEFSHSPSELTGDSILLSKACNLASRKGQLIVVSAGNYGSSDWKYITFPADADSVVSVGSVDRNLKVSDFSSRGNPNSHNDFKPKLVAIGEETGLGFTSGAVGYGNGTSFSAPQITGALACLKSAFPNIPNHKIKNALYQSCHQYYQPDNNIGFGVPNLELAYRILQDKPVSKTNPVLIYPNPTTNCFVVNSNSMIESIYIYNQLGAKVESLIDINCKMKIVTVPIGGSSYIVKVITKNQIYTSKIVTLN